jgi:hypothetical protein
MLVANDAAGDRSERFRGAVDTQVDSDAAFVVDQVKVPGVAEAFDPLERIGALIFPVESRRE